MDANTGLYDIYGLWHVPFWKTQWFFISLGVLLLLLLLGLLFFVIKAWRRVQQITFWDKALAEINNLINLSFSSPEEGYAIYTRVVFVLKEYLGERYNFPANAMTDDELLIFLAGTSCPAEILQLIERIFKGGLEIRFGGQRPYHEVMLEVLNTAVIIIKGTLPTTSHS